jgi:hypothetical protein
MCFDKEMHCTLKKPGLKWGGLVVLVSVILSPFQFWIA